MSTASRRAFVPMAAVGLLVVAGAARAGDFTIADGNSDASFDINSLSPNSRVGMDQWRVDGVNHMFSQWFWFRTDGMTQEARINSLPLIGAFTSNTNLDPRHDTFYAGFGAANSFTIETTFSLSGGSAGSRRSDVAEQIRITNHGSTPRTFSFFQYCDFDLDNDIQDDEVALLNANSVRQLDLLSGTIVAETVLVPTFTFSEMNVYAATLIKLDDNAVDNLDGSVGPLVGRRDYTWAFQWDFVLNPGDSYLISKDKLIIPSPGALALLGLGGLVIGRRRR